MKLPLSAGLLHDVNDVQAMSLTSHGIAERDFYSTASAWSINYKLLKRTHLSSTTTTVKSLASGLKGQLF